MQIFVLLSFGCAGSDPDPATSQRSSPSTTTPTNPTTAAIPDATDPASPADPPCDAQTRAHIGSEGFASLADAFAAAGPNAVIELCDGEHRVSTPLRVVADVEVRSRSGVPTDVLITGDGGPAFAVRAVDVTLTVRDVTLADGRGVVGGIIEGGSLQRGAKPSLQGEVHLSNVIATRNRANWGGVVAADIVIAESCVLFGNSVDAEPSSPEGIGGALYGREVLVSASLLVGNEAERGGAVGVREQLVSEISIYEDNVARWGGAAWVEDGLWSSVKDTYVHNEAVEQGGAVWIRTADSVSMPYTLFAGNRVAWTPLASPEGGALYLEMELDEAQERIVDAQGVVFAANEATSGQGGGLALQTTRRGPLSWYGGGFDDNQATRGGAMAVLSCLDGDPGALAFYDLQASGNSAIQGAGIQLGAGCVLVADNLWLEANDGGAVDVDQQASFVDLGGQLIGNEGSGGAALQAAQSALVVLSGTRVTHNISDSILNAAEAAIVIEAPLKDEPPSPGLVLTQVDFGDAKAANQPTDLYFRTGPTTFFTQDFIDLVSVSCAPTGCQ